MANTNNPDFPIEEDVRSNNYKDSFTGVVNNQLSWIYSLKNTGKPDCTAQPIGTHFADVVLVFLTTTSISTVIFRKLTSLMKWRKIGQVIDMKILRGTFFMLIDIMRNVLLLCNYS
uniref:Uncharacterized protein n=1 Tax=Glycine max TaxID=3847 RepID=A0A0R0HJ67_SOYBN